MGTIKIICQSKFLFFCQIIFAVQVTHSQFVIFGKITTEKQEEIQNASVVLKDSVNGVLNYTFSDTTGKYSLELDQIDKQTLQFSALGYETKTIEFNNAQGETKILVNAVLKSKPTELKEVIINYKRPIFQKKDTITVRVENFTNGTEQTVEDLLQKIPGLQVDDNGAIKIGNQEIEKLMVEGDDFFERGYKILSKNMPAYAIEEVEILKNYSNNRLLKGIEQSDKVALNLKLNEKAKRVWFGNVDFQTGLDDFYHLRGNLMNFGKKNKYYLLTNLNNVGYDATGDIKQLIKPFRPNEPGTIGDSQSGETLLNLSPGELQFRKERTLFNNAELASVNAVFNPTEKLKIKTLGFFNWDETNFFRNSIEQVSVGTTNFINTEDYQIRNKKQISFGKLDFTYNPSKNKMLEATTQYYDGNLKDGSALLFNGTNTLERLKSKNNRFDQKMNYTYKFKEKKVLLLSGRYISEETPQNYSLNQFFYEDLFPENTEANQVGQLSNNKMNYAGFQVQLLDRKENGDLIELSLGNDYRKDDLITAFSLLDGTEEITRPEGFQNNIAYKVNDLYSIGKYRLKWGGVGLSAGLGIHQLHNKLSFGTQEETESPLFINPNLGLDWEINEKNKLNTSYSYNTKNTEILDVYCDYVLTGFRNFSRGTGGFNQLDASSLLVNYQRGNWSDRFFANTFIYYTKNHDFFSTNTLLSQNFNQSDKILVQDRDLLSISTKVDYFLKFMSSNLKLDLSYNQIGFKNSINSGALRTVLSTSYGYGFELRSGFSGVFNYHLGTKWDTSEIQTSITNSFTNNLSFLDLSFVFSEKWDLQIQSERYFFGNLDTDNTYYFADLETRYKFSENKLTLGLVGKNLFNTNRFRTFSISDIGTSTASFRLLPRMLMARVEYRF